MLLAIDPSLTGTAWASTSDNNLIEFDTIEFNPKDKKSILERIVEIREALQNEIKKSSLVFIEGYAFGQIHSAHLSGEVGGMIRLLCYDLKVPHVIIPPTTHKLFSTGKGNTPKSLILKSVYKEYGIDVDSDDLADAISILKTGWAALAFVTGTTPTLNQKQQQAIKKLVPEVEKVLKDIKQ